MKHYKVLGYILAASFIFAACAEDITEGSNSKRPITFQATAQQDIVSKVAKASVSEPLKMKADNGETYYAYVSVHNDIESKNSSSLSTMRGAISDASTLNTNGFAVSAFKHTSGSSIGTPEFFYNESTTYASSKYSPSSKTYYWPTDGDVLTFIAHYPQATTTKNAAGLTLSAKTLENTQTITYEVPASAANQPDLLVAKLFEKKYGDGFVTSDGKAAFDFKHALTAVKFVAGTIPDGTITSIVLKNIKCAGTYTYTIDGDETVGGWEFIQDAGVDKITDFTLSTSDMVNSGAISGTGDISATGNILMMLPQTFSSADSKIVVNYTDSKGGEHTMEGSLNGTTWDAGTTVTYTIGIAGITSFTAVYPNVDDETAWKNGSTYEQGPVSEYTSTESFGMFVVNQSGTIVYSNVKMNSSAGSTATLTVEDGIDNFYFSKDYKYFLYYPYQEDNDLKTLVTTETYNTYYKQGATINDADRYATADKFLENVSDNWKVSTTQTDESKWRDQDLQTAAIDLTTDNTTKITTGSATMKHRMGLAVINLAKNQKTGVVAKRFYVDATYYWNTMATATMTVQPSGTFSSASGNTLPLGTSNTRYCILSTTQSTSFTTTSTYTVRAFNTSLSSGGADSGNNWTWSGTGTDNTVTSIEPAAPSTTYYAWEKYTIAIGDVLYSDGSLSKCTNADLISDEYKNRTAIAIVFALNGDMSTVDKNTSKWTHGYALAVNTAGRRTWGPMGTGTNVPYSAPSNAQNAIKDMEGYTNTTKINNNASYPAAYYAWRYSAKSKTNTNIPVTSPYAHSNWFLPSCGQWYKVAVNLCGLPATPSTWQIVWQGGSGGIPQRGIQFVTAINDKLSIIKNAGYNYIELCSTSYGHDAYMWSSTNMNGNCAYAAQPHTAANFYFCGSGDGDEYRSLSSSVRPAIAF